MQTLCLPLYSVVFDSLAPTLFSECPLLLAFWHLSSLLVSLFSLAASSHAACPAALHCLKCGCIGLCPGLSLPYLCASLEDLIWALLLSFLAGPQSPSPLLFHIEEKKEAETEIQRKDSQNINKLVGLDFPFPQSRLKQERREGR